MKIEIEVSNRNEFTDSPWWIIIDPRQMFILDPHIVASMISGPFFSREEAEDVLRRRRHHYSKNAVVYCHTGCFTQQYRMACRAPLDLPELKEAMNA